MSDKLIAINNFKYGLDSRRDALTSVPGTLAAIVNGHINAGGEIEQRFSFARDANTYPANTFGLQDTALGLITFGSDASPSGPLPTGVSYQQLKPPTAFSGSIFDVPFTWSYLGKAYAIVIFASLPGYFLYYDGTLVGASRNGQILASDFGFGPEGLSELAVDLANQVNLIPGWSATPNIDQFGNALTGSVIVTTPISVQSGFVTSVDSASGLLGVQPIDQGGQGTPGVSAIASFKVTGGNPGDTFTVKAPFNKDGTGVAVLANAIPWNTSANQTSTDIAVAIRANAPLFNYSAGNFSGTISVYAPPSFGNFTFNLEIDTTGTGTVGAATATVGNFQGSISPNPLVVTKTVVTKTGAGAGIVSGTVNASSSGAVGAVTFAWAETDQNGTVLVTPGGAGIVMSTNNGPSCGFSHNFGFVVTNQSVQGYFKCTITDSGPPAKSTSIVFFVKLQTNFI